MLNNLSHCPFCEHAYENQWHLLYGCNHVEQVRTEANFWPVMQHPFMEAAVFN